MRSSRGAHMFGGLRRDPSLVLIAHPDERARTLYVENALFFTNHRVLEATTAREAAEKIRRLRPDAVFLSIALPDLEGWDGVRTLLGDPGARDTRVVVIVEGEEESGARLAQEVGVEVVLEDDLRADMVGQLRLAVTPRRALLRGTEREDASVAQASRRTTERGA